METPQAQSPFELPPDAAARQQMRDTTKAVAERTCSTFDGNVKVDASNAGAASRAGTGRNAS